MMPKELRLKLDKDIKHAAHGSVVYGEALIMRYRKTSNQTSRFVIVVSAKVSKKAVVRNLIRRRISAILMASEPYMMVKIDALISVKTNAKDLNFDQLKLEIWKIFLKARLVSQSTLLKN